MSWFTGLRNAKPNGSRAVFDQGDEIEWREQSAETQKQSGRNTLKQL